MLGWQHSPQTPTSYFLEDRIAKLSVESFSLALGRRSAAPNMRNRRCGKPLLLENRLCSGLQKQGNTLLAYAPKFRHGLITRLSFRLFAVSIRYHRKVGLVVAEHKLVITMGSELHDSQPWTCHVLIMVCLIFNTGNLCQALWMCKRTFVWFQFFV